ncbi:MAG TPA: hypothetical protein VJB97_03825 [Candidatus Paceibacterota bacterium]
MSREFALRSCAFIVALICGVFFSAWLALCIMIVLFIRYAAWEALFVALALDLVWFVPLESGGLLHTVPFIAVIAAAALWLLEPVRAEILH